MVIKACYSDVLSRSFLAWIFSCHGPVCMYQRQLCQLTETQNLKKRMKAWEYLVKLEFFMQNQRKNGTDISCPSLLSKQFYSYIQVISLDQPCSRTGNLKHKKVECGIMHSIYEKMLKHKLYMTGKNYLYQKKKYRNYNFKLEALPPQLRAIIFLINKSLLLTMKYLLPFKSDFLLMKVIFFSSCSQHSQIFQVFHIFHSLVC